MQIIIRGEPAEYVRDAMLAWLPTIYQGAAIVNGDDKDQPYFGYAGQVIVVTTEVEEEDG